MKYLKKLAELVIDMVWAITVVIVVITGVIAYKIDCTKNDNGTYNCSTEVAK